MGTAPKISSGIELVDETWGGLYLGGSYLAYGRAACSRSLLPYLFAAYGGDDERCLYLSADAPPDILRRANALGVDLQSGGCADVQQLPRFDASAVTDDQLASALSDVIADVERARPQRVVIDDFMPFIGFDSFVRFRAAYIDMLERIDAIDATLVVTMAEPANDESAAVIDFMRKQMTGALHITSPNDESDTMTHRVEFLPNIGHTGREVERPWDVRSWLRPTEAKGSARRFRFSEGAGPSPRHAQWADENARAQSIRRHEPPTPESAPGSDQSVGRSSPQARPTAPSIPTIRLGADRPAPPPSKTSLRSRSTGDQGESHGRRIPGIPLGSTNEPQRPSSVDVPSPSEEAYAHSVLTSAQRPAYHSLSLADSPHYRTSHTDREAFRARLQRAFLRHGVDHTPFVLIAMRMDRPDEREARPFDFDFILDLVSESLRDQDDVLVDLTHERLIVMLAESDANASQPFFGRLKHRLREEAPQLADYLMQSVSAIVVPDGRPFRTAEEFLTYALDED